MFSRQPPVSSRSPGFPSLGIRGAFRSGPGKQPGRLQIVHKYLGCAFQTAEAKRVRGRFCVDSGDLSESTCAIMDNVKPAHGKRANLTGKTTATTFHSNFGLRYSLDQNNIQDSLKFLPVFVNISKRRLVLHGSSYFTRLWCMWELYVMKKSDPSLDQVLFWSVDEHARPPTHAHTRRHSH